MQKLIKKTLAIAFSFAILKTPILSGLETESAALSESMLETVRQHQAEWEASGISNYEYWLTVNGESRGVTQVRNGELTESGQTIDEVFSQLLVASEEIESLTFGVIDPFSREMFDFLPKKTVKTDGDVIEITHFEIQGENSSNEFVEILRQYQIEWAESGISNYEYELTTNGESLNPTHVINGTLIRGVAIDEVFSKFLTDREVESMEFGVVDAFSGEMFDFLPRIVQTNDNVFKVTNFRVIEDEPALDDEFAETLRQHQAEWEASGISNYDYELTTNGELMDPTQVRNGFTKEGSTFDEVFLELLEASEDIESMEFGVIDAFSRTEYDFLPKKIVQTNGDVVEITHFKIIEDEPVLDDDSQLLPNLQVGGVWADFSRRNVTFHICNWNGTESLRNENVEVEYRINGSSPTTKTLNNIYLDVYDEARQRAGLENNVCTPEELFSFDELSEADDWGYNIEIFIDPNDNIAEIYEGENNKFEQSIRINLTPIEPIAECRDDGVVRGEFMWENQQLSGSIGNYNNYCANERSSVDLVEYYCGADGFVHERTVACDRRCHLGACISEANTPSAGFEDEVFTTDSSGYQNPFPDTDTDSVEGRAAAELFERGVIGGFIDGEFKGYRPVNRAEAAKFLLLAAGIQVGNLQNNGRFSDVKDGEWYEKFVMKAAEQGIINGYADGRFKPNSAVNIAEFLKMLTNTFDLETDLAHDYIDVPADAWFSSFVGIASRYNLFPGRDSPYILKPANALTRNEVAVAIYQYLNNRND